MYSKSIWHKFTEHLLWVGPSALEGIRVQSAPPRPWRWTWAGGERDTGISNSYLSWRVLPNHKTIYPSELPVPCLWYAGNNTYLRWLYKKQEMNFFLDAGEWILQVATHYLAVFLGRGWICTLKNDVILRLTVSTREIQNKKWLKQNTRFFLFKELDRGRWPLYRGSASIAAPWGQEPTASFGLVAFLYVGSVPRYGPKWLLQFQPLNPHSRHQEGRKGEKYIFSL